VVREDFLEEEICGLGMISEGDNWVKNRGKAAPNEGHGTTRA
jgi:hypothetical protein